MNNEVIRSSEFYLDEERIRHDTCNDYWDFCRDLCRTHGLTKARQVLSELQEQYFSNP